MKAGQTPYWINFFLTDNFGKEFQILSMPYQKGDALKGYLRDAKNMVLNCREVASGILRKHHGFRGMKLAIKVEMLYKKFPD